MGKINQFINRCMPLVILLILALIAFSACGGGGGSTSTDGEEVTDPGDNPGGNNPGDDPGDESAAFPGYDFALAEGSFWEFGFDDHHRSWYLGTSNSSSSDGIFRITLGAPVTIEGITAYPMNITHVSGDDILDTMTIRWSHIALDGGRILGSTDGITLSIIFDAFNGTQPGGGFFASFSSDKLVTATNGQIDNDYINENADYLVKASSSGGCEYFPDYGTICPGDDREGLTTIDYFQAGIGPVGYYWRSYNTDSQGNSGAEIETNIGLISFSVEGDDLYDPPDVPELNSGSLAIYYSLYVSPPSVAYDLYNAPTPDDPPSVLMRYLPELQTGSTLTTQLSDEADYELHALTEGERLLLLKRNTTDNIIQAVEYDPASYSPLDTTTTRLGNAGNQIHYGALTVAGDYFYFQKFDSSTNPAPAPWSDTYDLLRQYIGSDSSSYSVRGKTTGFNHLLSDGSGTNSPFIAYITNDSEGLCSADNYLYFFQRLDINPLINPVNLDGACDTSDYFSDLTLLVHSFAMDSGGLYIARSNVNSQDTQLFRVDRSSSELQLIYEREFLNQRRALIIDVSNGLVLLHSFDRDNFSDNEVILLDTQNTSNTADDTMETLTLPGMGIPMNLQLMVTP